MKLDRLLESALFYPRPYHLGAAKNLLRLLPGVSFSKRLEYDAVDRPYYAFCMFHAARLAWRLGHKKVSAVEFGVAGGNGLVAMEALARQIEKEVPVEFELYGFDSAAGLPAAEGYKDLPYHWQPSFFKMDRAALESRLKKARLVIGDVRDTARGFLDRAVPAPLGACFFDLDYYSSTRDALRVFEAAPERLLPRVFSYFDDIIGTADTAFNRWTGELAAIDEFNQAHEAKKLAPIHGFPATRKLPSMWNHQIYVLHDFGHPAYNRFVSAGEQELRLAA